MNIYDPYPDTVTVGCKPYALDLAFDNVLRCIDIENDPALTMQDRRFVQCALLLENEIDIPKTLNEQCELVKAVFDLFPKPEETGGERFLDFHQDAALIRSAFFRIGVDLTRDRIHFCQFYELLADLPRDTALMRTIEIRQKPIPKPTKDNAEQIAALQKAKARVAIRMSEEERRSLFAESLKNSTLLKG